MKKIVFFDYCRDEEQTSGFNVARLLVVTRPTGSCLVAEIVPTWRELIGPLDSTRKHYAAQFVEALAGGDQEWLEELYASAHEISQGAIRSRLLESSNGPDTTSAQTLKQ